jgi:hypothetical protein
MIFNYALTYDQIVQLYEQVPLPVSSPNCTAIYANGYPKGFYNNLPGGIPNSRVFCQYGYQCAPLPFVISPSPLQSAPYAWWGFNGNLLDSIGAL